MPIFGDWQPSPHSLSLNGKGQSGHTVKHLFFWKSYGFGMTRGWVDDDRTIPLRLWPGLTWNLSTQGRFPLDIYLVWVLYKSIHISLIPDTPSPVFLWAMCSAPEDSDLPVIQVHIWTTWQLQMVSPFIGIIEITGEQTWSMWKEKEVFWIIHDCCLLDDK